MDQEVNGETLAPVWGWRWGRYLITTDSDQAAESGIGYFIVAKLTDSGYGRIELTTVSPALSLADAVTIAKIDAQKEGN